MRRPQLCCRTALCWEPPLSTSIQLNPRRAAALLAVGLALVALSVALLGVDRAAVLDAAARWDLSLLPLVVACFVLTLLARSLRAWALLPSGLPAGELVAAIAFAFLPTLLAPGKLGVLVRPVLLRTRLGVPLGLAIAGAVAERVIDLGVLLGLGAWVFGAGLAGLGWGLAALVGLGAVGWTQRRLLAERLARAGVRFEGATGARLGAVVAGTGLFWAAGVGAAALVLAGMGQADPLLRGAGLAAAGSAAAVGVPVPGAVGVYETAGTAALGGLGVPTDVALACALVLHTAQLGTNTLLAIAGAIWWLVVPAPTIAAGSEMAGVDPTH